MRDRGFEGPSRPPPGPEGRLLGEEGVHGSNGAARNGHVNGVDRDETRAVDGRAAAIGLAEDPARAPHGRPGAAAEGLDEAGEGLDEAVDRARDALLARQDADGSWCFELEADCTIPSEYVLMTHFMDEVDPDLQRRIGVYLRARQGEDGGWPLYHGGELDLSCTVKTYWALKLVGDDPDAPHMRRAREAVLARGGARNCNVFTRITLALFGQIPWRGTPFLPVEIVLLPRWFPFHLSKVSYWSRAVMVPLSILCSLRARAANPTGTDVRELFTTPPEEERHYFKVRSSLHRVFLLVERTARRLEPVIAGLFRKAALRRAEAWFTERLNGEDGLGAIFPAMVNAYESLALLGYAPDHPARATARAALRKLLVLRDEDAYCQPCLSPVWDTAITSLALQETDPGREDEVVQDALLRGHVWLLRNQILSGPADWREARPDLRPGGWAFEYANPHYPDLDDTSMVVWALQQSDPERYAEAIERACEWLAGMQSRNGGFASFDADNTHDYLNHIPFADHGALLDPPTADVTARCVTAFTRLDARRFAPRLERALEYLWSDQEEDGSWFGRWGTNYVYGTWSVLVMLEALQPDQVDRERVRRAVDWLRSVQREDGGWGETNDSYADRSRAGRADRSTSFQTAWALLGLMAAGEGDSEAVRRGVAYLRATQGEDGLWDDPEYTAPGFPRVFYLRYHGYRRYFPLWALARYRTVQRATARAE